MPRQRESQEENPFRNIGPTQAGPADITRSTRRAMDSLDAGRREAAQASDLIRRAEQRPALYASIEGVNPNTASRDPFGAAASDMQRRTQAPRGEQRADAPSLTNAQIAQIKDELSRITPEDIRRLQREAGPNTAQRGQVEDRQAPRTETPRTEQRAQEQPAPRAETPRSEQRAQERQTAPTTDTQRSEDQRSNDPNAGLRRLAEHHGRRRKAAAGE